VHHLHYVLLQKIKLQKPKTNLFQKSQSTPRARRSQFNTSDAIERTIVELLPEEDAGNQSTVYLSKVYINHLKTISVEHDAKVARFLYETKKCKRFVDEANEITFAVRPQDNLRFDLASFSPTLLLGYAPDYVPQLMVRVVRVLTKAQLKWRDLRSHLMRGRLLDQNILSANDHGGKEDGSVELLFTWSMNKFMGRLEMMRDIYHNWMNGISFTVDLKEDPWVEAGPVELDFWIQEKEYEKQQEIEM
jgi:hypothetical protein